MAINIKLKVFKTKQEVAEYAAQDVVKDINAKPNFVLGLATGSTPEGAYAEMAKANKAGKVDFSKVMTFNLDEYWGLDCDHDQSYRYFMNDRLFNHINIRPWNTNVLNGKAWNPKLECDAFEQKIVSVGGIDTWLIGIGPNGHIAFNEPGSPVDSRTRLVSLTQATINANSDGRFFSDPKDVPSCALSAGIGTIREARKIIMLATGVAKAEVVAAAYQGSLTPDIPCSLLQDHEDVTFIVDEEAASLIK